MRFLKTVLAFARAPKVVVPKQSYNLVFKTQNARMCAQAAATKDYLETIVQELCNGDAKKEKLLRILMMEVEVMRQDGRSAPDNLQSRHWKHLLELETRSLRRKYLLFLWKTEKSVQNEKAKKEARRKEKESTPMEIIKEYPDDQVYGLGHQSLFLRLRESSMNAHDNCWALQAMMYGQKVVIDCSYEQHMVLRENLNAAKQMTYVFGDNRIHRDPFDIHLCNVNLQGNFMEQLKRNIPSIVEPWFPLNIHSESYLDIFPKEKLVYLTPHCREELTAYDPESIYIVGCMVDKINNEPLSLAKAKRDNIRMAKLPLDRYLEWAPGAKKNLNINHMIPILSDLKLTGNWEYSLRHIPRRKLMETKIMQMQSYLKDPALKRNTFNSYRNMPNFKQLLQTQEKKPKGSKRKSLFDDDDE